MHCFEKMLSASGGSAPGPHWGTSILQAPSCPPLEKNPACAHGFITVHHVQWTLGKAAYHYYYIGGYLHSPNAHIFLCISFRSLRVWFNRVEGVFSVITYLLCDQFQNLIATYVLN